MAPHAVSESSGEHEYDAESKVARACRRFLEGENLEQAVFRPHERGELTDDQKNMILDRLGKMTSERAARPM